MTTAVAGSRATKLSQFAGEPNRPLLVGGCPRSGTTLLRSILHSHPELAMPRETRFVLEAWNRRWTFGDLRDADNRRALARWIFDRKETWRGHLGLDHDQAVERLVAASPTLGSMLATPFAMYAERHGTERWGDKRPTYAARMEVVWGLFPNAQFVNVVRDPRACVASMRKLGWDDGEIVPGVELWLRIVNRVDAWRPRLAPDQLLDLRFEDLVSEPEGTLAAVAAFSGLTCDEAALAEMLSYHERDETRSERFHANLSRPPDPGRATAWTNVLEPDEVAFVEAATGPLLLRYGYGPVAARVSPRAGLMEALRERQRRKARAWRSFVWKARVRNVGVNRRRLAAVRVDDPVRAGVATR